MSRIVLARAVQVPNGNCRGEERGGGAEWGSNERALRDVRYIL